jgi:hypothetical protein
VAPPKPDHLFEQAEQLAKAPAAGAPRQVDLRRAVSAAYYGVFHYVSAAAADMIVGATKRSIAEYGRVYRSIDHRALRDLCEELRKPTLPARYLPHVPAKGVGNNIPRFATTLIELQEKRHSADYDPLVRLRLSDAQIATRSARRAVELFEKATSQRRNTFLSLLVFPPRR